MIAVVGIGADGWASVGQQAREIVLAADLLVGGDRQLDLVPAEARGERRPWPKSLITLVDELPALDDGRSIVVMASGDPLMHGVGVTIVRRLGAENVRIIPAVSSYALACARLRWPQAEAELVSATSRVPEVVVPALQPGRKLVVLGFGARTAADQPPAAALHVVALEVRGSGRLIGRGPGLPDDAFEHDGQITKRDVRAITLAALVPVPGQLLWDIGAGSGSVAIEWMRAAPGARAIAIEADEQRAARIARNALRLGVPSLEVVTGEAPEALDGLRERPDAIFIGGGLTGYGLLTRCRKALRRGGRLVANVATVEGEIFVSRAQAEQGGRLTRLAVAHAEPADGLMAWRPAAPVTQYELRVR